MAARPGPRKSDGTSRFRSKSMRTSIGQLATEPIMRRTAIAGFALVSISGLSPGAAAQNAATAEEAAAIVREAVVWGYPLVVMDRTRRVHLNPPPGRGTPVAPNTFRHVDRLADHTNRTVVMPNNDTLYSVAWLKLAGSPVVLTLPAAPDGRYVSF